jgi:pimeloyl-ACP methyl ester carboxylesterase
MEDYLAAPAPAAPVPPEQRLTPGAHVADLDGLKLAYTVSGSGPLLVVPAPGWGIGSGYLRNGLKALETHFTLVVCDPRGNGASSRPDNQHDMGSAHMAADLEALRAYWGVERMHLLGHSSAGAVAMAFAARWPQRVQRLVLVDSDLLGFDSSASFKKFAAARRDDPLYSAALARLMSAKPTSDEEFTDLLLGIRPYYFAEPTAGVPRLLKTMSDAPSLWAYGAYYGADRDTPGGQAATLGAINAPTLVLVGQEDAFCPVAVAQRIASGIAGARLQVFERSGHYPWIEQPGEFFEAVTAFLLG